MARYDDLDTSAIAYATFLACILLLLVILLVRALCFYWVEGESDRKLSTSHYVSADEEIREQKLQVSGYRMEQVEVVAADGEEAAEPQFEERIQIPVEKAKEILLKELTGSPTEPST